MLFDWSVIFFFFAINFSCMLGTAIAFANAYNLWNRIDMGDGLVLFQISAMIGWCISHTSKKEIDTVKFCRKILLSMLLSYGVAILHLLVIATDSLREDQKCIIYSKECVEANTTLLGV